MAVQGDDKNKGIYHYVFSKLFLKHILILAATVLISIGLINVWLRFYTNHGQKIQVPDVINLHASEGQSTLLKSGLDFDINDSVFVVGQKGGIILNQNPEGGAFVKENRKIYVTITKYNSESIAVSDLPTLYGNAFEQKKNELKYKDIESKIKAYKYDPAEPNHILEVWYGETLIISRDIIKESIKINKGDTLAFVLSERGGGDVIIPDLRCMTLEQADFILQSYQLALGKINKPDSFEPDATFYVIGQNPPYDGITNFKMGQAVELTVTSEKPVDCL